MSVKRAIANNVKNIVGWRTPRKIVVFSVDDYGNVRIDSKKARAAMDQQGAKTYSIFDRVDTLETESDLLALFDTLSSVKDQHGRHAVFTAFAVPKNINFEKVIASGYKEAHFELLPHTWKKLPGYENLHTLWKQGIANRLIIPQFHGREHLNLRVFNECLKQGDEELIRCIANRSYASMSDDKFKNISYPAAFDFWDFEENEGLKKVIAEGLDDFENVFGFRASHFMAPRASVHSTLYQTLKNAGVRYIDIAAVNREHQGQLKYKRSFNYTGKRNALGQVLMVRNVVFEPNALPINNSVDFSMKQVEAAFRFNRPAIISSHRVNYCGHIDENNRKKGLAHLHELLARIVKRWPEVEFMCANELGDLILQSTSELTINN